MDYIVKLILDTLVEFILFRIGRMTLLIVTFGHYPDNQDFKDDIEKYGHLGGYYFGGHHLLCIFVGMLVLAMCVYLIWF